MINEKTLQSVFEYIDNHREDIIKDLCDISSIKSVSDASSDVKPFGQGCQDVLNCMLKKGEREGFVSHNYENYVGSILLNTGAEENIGMWAHLDVVPEGEGWMSEPYTPVERMAICLDVVLVTTNLPQLEVSIFRRQSVI